jgi:ApeA N-terminal domain 1
MRYSEYSLHNIDVDIIYIAKIKFNNPVSIYESLNYVYQWRQFFNQLTMTSLPVNAMAVASAIDQNAIFSDLYIPSFVSNEDPEKAEYPASPPFSWWSERGKLSDCMKKWLELAPTREAFRACLDGVIGHLHSGIQQMDIVELCAGIDSLDELKQKSEFPDGLLDSMANAVFNVVNPPIDDLSIKRIKAHLGQLKNRSLSEKMKVLSEQAVPDDYAPQCKAVVNLAKKLRSGAAHDGAIGEEHDGRLQPVVRALAAMCVAFELSSCGVPFAEGSPRWKHHFFDNAMELDRLKK